MRHHLDVGRELAAPPAAGCRVVFEVPLVAAPYAAVWRVALGRIAALVEDPAP